MFSVDGWFQSVDHFGFCDRSVSCVVQLINETDLKNSDVVISVVMFVAEMLEKCAVAVLGFNTTLVFPTFLRSVSLVS